VERRIDEAGAAVEVFLGKFHDQDRVLRREADDRDEADLEIDVVGMPRRLVAATTPSAPSGMSIMTENGMAQLS
jgi:hypothetical protein